VIETAGSTKLQRSSDSPDRGWPTADTVPFYTQVEDVDGE